MNLVSRLPAPVAPRHPHAVTVHGIAVTDDYAWLKAENWREVLTQPELLPEPIRAYLAAENATRPSFSPAARPCARPSSRRCAAGSRRTIPPCRRRTVPSPISAATGKAASIPCLPRAAGRRPRDDPARRRPGGAGHPFFDLGAADHSPDHRLLAWSADIKGSEYFTIRVRDLASGRELADDDPDDLRRQSLDGDSSGFYYIELDENHRPVRVKRHRLGTPADADEIVYEEADPGFFVHLGTPSRGAFIADRRAATTRPPRSACSTARTPRRAPRLVAAAHGRTAV